MEINQGTLAIIVVVIFIIGLGYYGDKKEEQNPTKKRCKFCDETIRIKATICKHCGSHLDD